MSNKVVILWYIFSADGMNVLLQTPIICCSLVTPCLKGYVLSI